MKRARERVTDLSVSVARAKPKLVQVCPCLKETTKQPATGSSHRGLATPTCLAVGCSSGTRIAFWPHHSRASILNHGQTYVVFGVSSYAMFNMNFYDENTTRDSNSNNSNLISNNSNNANANNNNNNNNNNHRYIPASPPPSYRSTGNPEIQITPHAIEPTAPVTSDVSAIDARANAVFHLQAHPHARQLADVLCHSNKPLVPSHHVHHQQHQQQQPQQQPQQQQQQQQPQPGQGSSGQLPIYIYDLPYSVRKAICDLLDADGSWRQLGGEYMGLSDVQLTLISHALFRGGSPTNDLLTKWEQTNPKVGTLFRYLASMKHRRAMTLLRPFVNEPLALQYFDTSTQSSIDSCNYWDILNHESVNHAIFKRNQPGPPHHHHHPHHQVPSNSSNVVNLTGNNSWSHLGAVGGVNVPVNNKSSDNSNEPTGQMAGVLKVVAKSDQEMMKEASVGSSSLSCLSSVEEGLEVSYKELLMGTDGFSEDRIIGSGGFGIVYLGELKGTKVAVKRLKGGTGSHSSISQAITELKVLNRYRIDNILPLYGISLDGPEACILYQYMPNGSLSDRLLCECNSNPLTWLQRSVIAEGVAKALNYLHSLKGKPLIHGDVKSANVLLDSQFEPKLGDFGLSRVMTQSESSSSTHITVTSVHGTSVYLPPEYLRQKMLSPAVDVYSYGIVVLEMATGKRAYDGNKLLIDLVEDELTSANVTSLKDPKVDSSLHSHWFERLINLGVDCGHKNKKKRPTMNQVLQMFQKWNQVDMESPNLGESSESESNLMKIKTPLELQMWHNLIRHQQQQQVSSTVCPTVGSVVNISLESGTSNQIDSPSESINQENNLSGDKATPPVQVNLEEASSPSSSSSSSFVIPLLTELGISKKTDDH